MWGGGGGGGGGRELVALLILLVCGLCPVGHGLFSLSVCANGRPCFYDWGCSRIPSILFSNITKTCLFKYSENSTTPRNKKNQIKYSDIFFIFLLKP